ncbi:GntR family transcriptional regulator [Schaalia vaccimaxillae]|uniref:GntR family transcriptional regulator n=1 Tax=Schaalia vaccimaxillae TaxID=183916 RepID=UPI0003B72701|nr:GntR family transcriptional regulator [Schaalia vaccimaxillae]
MKAKYSEVYEALVRRISQMNPGDRLESEAQLASSFNVAPMTVRRALMLLKDEGLTVARPGSGTFVVDPKASARKVASDSSSALDTGMRVGGLRVSPDLHSRLVSVTVTAAESQEAQFFNLGPEVFVLRVIRTYWDRGIDGSGDGDRGEVRPIGIEVLRGDASRFKSFDSRLLCEGPDVLLSESYRLDGDGGGLVFEGSVQTVLPDDELCEVLGVGQKDPCLRILTIARDARSNIVAEVELFLDGCRVRLEF